MDEEAETLTFIEFQYHGEMRITYTISIEMDADKTICRATEDERQRYTAYVERWGASWIAQEVSDTGSGAIIVEDCKTKYEAVRWALLFVACRGGRAVIDN